MQRPARHPWLAVTGWAAILKLLLMFLGCAGGLQQAAGPTAILSELPKQLRTRQVVATLAPATPEQWALLATVLAQAYDLQQVGVFPLASMGVHCLVFQVPTDRTVGRLLNSGGMLAPEGMAVYAALMQLDQPPPMVYQLRIVLRGISPLIWRRLLVSSNTTLAHLHQMLQILFTWSNEHLHHFHI